jgi:hypothetical protein
MNEFLNGKSMITPGVAGALVIVISNTAFVQFGIPSKWSSLILSFLLGTLVFVGTVAPLWQKGLFYLVNSAIIFSVAVGTNQVGAGLTPTPKEYAGIVPEFVEEIHALPPTVRGMPPPPIAAKPIDTGKASPQPTPIGTIPPAAKAPKRKWFHNWFD